MTTIEVAIFSFNRGQYLRNCIESIERNMPTAVYHVFDDGSDDPATCAYLQTLGPKVTRNQEKIAGRHGGFYRNMQAALDQATSDYLLLLQEDMQIVRQMTSEDILEIGRVFKHFKRAAFVSPVFLKGRKREFFDHNYSPETDVPAYIWRDSSDNLVPACYTDVAIISPTRLRAAGWNFQQSELENGIMAKQKFGLMPQLSNPFCFYLTDEPAYRGKVLTIGAKLAFRLAGNTIKNYLDMSPDAARLFVNRSTSIRPYAEDFIETVDPTVPKPYKFNGYRNSWLTLLLNKIELLTRRFL